MTSRKIIHVHWNLHLRSPWPFQFGAFAWPGSSGFGMLSFEGIWSLTSPRTGSWSGRSGSISCTAAQEQYLDLCFEISSLIHNNNIIMSIQTIKNIANYHKVSMRWNILAKAVMKWKKISLMKITFQKWYFIVKSIKFYLSVYLKYQMYLSKYVQRS